jgi:hypothetical protein
VKIVNALCFAALALASQVRSAEPVLPRDGWASGEVEAVENAPDWCCWNSRNEGGAPRTSCRLDSDHGSFGNRDDATTNSVRVYARTTGGRIDRLRALSASCRVETATPIRELGPVTTDDSARWLIGHGKARSLSDDIRENALAALAMHRGNIAFDSLAATARTDDHAETRERAVFWLAILRGPAGSDVATTVMFNDKETNVRQLAAFAVSQGNSPRAVQDLIRLGNSDRDGDVRGHAWFCLAQTEAPNAEEAMFAALRNDKDDDVREQAIFALSQLPDERATRALIVVAEDRTLSNEQRKRAVFWLAQSDAKPAQAWLDKVLTRNRTD